MITAEISGFSGSYIHLNAVHSLLRISRLGLIRSVITVGHKNWSGVFSSGFWRFTELLSMMLAHTETNNGHIRLSRVFWDLESSEKRATAYHLGQGFAKATIEILLNIPWLIHLRHLGNRVHLTGRTIRQPKVVYYSCGKNPGEPDLIGFDQSKNPHIFEAKGYSSGFHAGRLQHAINQVSQVISVDGRMPETRVACYYDMSNDPVHARIVDPNHDQSEGVRLDLKFEHFIEAYYQTFTKDDAWTRGIPFKVFKRAYRVLPLGAPFYYFGIDENILFRLKEGKFPDDDFNWYLQKGVYLFDKSSDRGVSLGLDGIIVIDSRGLSNNKRRQLAKASSSLLRKESNLYS